MFNSYKSLNYKDSIRWHDTCVTTLSQKGGFMKKQLLQVVILISLVFTETTMGKGLTVAVAFLSKETKGKNSQEMIISKIEERLIKCERYRVITYQSRTSIDSLLKYPESTMKNRPDRLITVSIDTSENMKVLTLKMIESESFVICASVQEIMRGDVGEFIRSIESMVDTLIERETEYCKNVQEEKKAEATHQNDLSGEEVKKADQQHNEGRLSQEQTANTTSSDEQINRQMHEWNRYAVGAVIIILMMMMVTLSSQPKN